MNWFRKHLNWTLVFCMIAGYAVAFGLTVPTYLISLLAGGEATYNFVITILWIVFLIFVTLISGWVLRNKGQSLWYLLFFILPLLLYLSEGSWALAFTPIGIFIYLALPNKKSRAL